MWCAGIRGALAAGVRRPALDRPAPGRPRRRTGARAGRRFGVRRHFRVAPWTDLVEVHWGRSVEAYVTPVADDVVGVALLGPAHHDYDRTLDSFAALRRHLGDAETLGPPRGAGPLHQQTQPAHGGRVRLVGDASGYVDALTGEGVRVGLAQAHAAVATLDDDVAPLERGLREGVDRGDPRLPGAHQRPARRRRVAPAARHRAAGRRRRPGCTARWSSGSRAELTTAGSARARADVHAG